MRWFAAELHSHTMHSDGQQTPEQLLAQGAEASLDLIALTDHNTDSGHKGLPFLPGIEWTTYYGHMTVLGLTAPVDWRDLNLDNVDDKLREIRRAGGIATVAHPYSEGGPLCTGCFWEYEVKDPTLLGAWEVWHGPQPQARNENPRSLPALMRLWDQGYRLAAVYGLDWHTPSNGKGAAVTYLGMDWPDDELPVPLSDSLDHIGHQRFERWVNSALEAIRRGRTLVTLGPLPQVLAIQDECVHAPGDTLRPGSVTLRVDVDMTARLQQWADSGITVEHIVIRGTSGIELARLPWQGRPLTIPLKVETGWFHLLLEGKAAGTPATIALTSPFYVRHQTLITAHAGADGTAANTLDGAQMLMLSGADCVEVDVRRHGDRLYLGHDVPVDPDSAPGLDALFLMQRRIPQVCLNLDLKTEGLVADVLALARDHGVESRLIITGGVSSQERTLFAHNLARLWQNEDDIILAQDMLKQSGQEGAAADALNVDGRVLTASLLETYGHQLSVWTVDEPEHLLLLLAAGVKGITTNNVAEALAIRRALEQDS